MHWSDLLPAPVRLRDWRPELPPGDLRSISVHWTAGDYTTVYPDYHFCIRGARDPHIVQTHDLRANMRDVRSNPDGPYAAHTAGRNSYSIGVALCGMLDAEPDDFGPCPITADQVETLVAVCARLAARYDIPLLAIRSHAEAAIDDGYFGIGPDHRWDIARLIALPSHPTIAETIATGEQLRLRIAAVFV